MYHYAILASGFQKQTKLDILRHLERVFVTILLIIPLAIGLVWGMYLDDAVYATFQQAQGLVATNARGKAPLYTLVLHLLYKIGATLPQASLLLSVIGWSVTIVAIYHAGKAAQRRVTALSAMTLVAFNPAILEHLGTETSWYVAVIWFAITATMNERWLLQISFLALSLGVHFSPSTVSIALLLLTLQAIRRRAIPMLLGVLLAVTILGLVLFAHQAEAVTATFADLGQWWRGIKRTTNEYEYHWLLLPLAGLGALSNLPGNWWLGALGLWSVIGKFGAPVALLVVTIEALLAIAGVEWMVHWVYRESHSRIPRLKLKAIVMTSFLLALTALQAAALYAHYQARPILRMTLERRTGLWLRDHTDADHSNTDHADQPGIILGPARTGYFAQRPTRSWDGSMGTVPEATTIIEALAIHPPAYCVSLNSIPWNRLEQTTWFQDHYQPVVKFESAYEGTAPYVIWAYQCTPFDGGDYQQLDVHLDGEIDLIGYRYWPDHVAPGEAVYVTLYLKASRAIGDAMQAVVQITSPDETDGSTSTEVWAHRDTIDQRSVLEDWWQTEQIIVDRVVLTPTGDIPVGASPLTVKMVAPDSQEPMPMYQNDDMAPIDRVHLGHVIVPWRGNLDTIQQTYATLDDQIVLRGYEVENEVSRDRSLDVALYWEALHPMNSTSTYVVFVHLVGAENQLVAGHDGPPANGRYPSSAWLPGDIVPDTHTLTLAPDTPPGEYQLCVGMYTWPDIERLRVWNEHGEEIVERAFVLQTIRVR